MSEDLNWVKKGFLVKPSPNLWWMQTHAMVPTVYRLNDEECRIYYSGRCINNISHIGWVTVNLNSPTRVIEQSKEPVLSPGRLGCFDDNGVTPSCIINHNNELYLYYIGWNPGTTTRMHLYGGLAISQDNGLSFKRYSEAPILERCPANPFINTAPFVVKNNNEWIIYYVSGVEWVHKDLPRYNIQIGTSTDGKYWKRDGSVAIDFVNNENAIARPYVIKENGIYKMWFSSKSDTYKLNYAESKDGITWKRMNKLSGLNLGADGEPDSEMMEYSVVINYNGQKIMFYNGNTYGKDGVLVAVTV